MGSGEGMAMGSGWRANGRATRSGWREWLTGWFWRGWGPESGKMGWLLGIRMKIRKLENNNTKTIVI
jgi:hypothetical protein